MDNLPMGTVVELKIDCLGNPIGTRGICFDLYDLGDDVGGQYIFENGEHCGFSKDEQAMFFSVVKHTNFSYIFSHVIKLSEDFKKGTFNIMRD